MAAADNGTPSKAQHFDGKPSDGRTLLSRRYEQLLRAEKFHDCVFRVTDDKCGALVRCHKLILSAASPVFEAMFYGPVREHRPEIDIDDMSLESFEAIVRYIYTGVVDYDCLSLEDTIELYYGAEKYLLMDLTADCLAEITRKLRFANILPALELSVCLDLQELLNVCMSFFRRCCLADPLFISYAKRSDWHVSRECIKGIIAANRREQKQLLWFVNEWCARECAELGVQRLDSALIEDLQLKDDVVALMGEPDRMGDSKREPCFTLQRSHFRACRPFVVDWQLHKWQMSLQSDRFVSLAGLVMPSRFRPSHTLRLTTAMQCFLDGTSPPDYTETFLIQISNVIVPQVRGSGSDGEEDDDDEEDEDESVADQRAKGNVQVIWSHRFSQRATKYNCDLNVRWDDGVSLAPDVEYLLEIIWEPQQAYGAEYPCSLLSDTVSGIRFREYNYQSGSLVKGLHYSNLTQALPKPTTAF